MTLCKTFSNITFDKLQKYLIKRIGNMSLAITTVHGYTTKHGSLKYSEYIFKKCPLIWKDAKAPVTVNISELSNGNVRLIIDADYKVKKLKNILRKVEKISKAAA